MNLPELDAWHMARALEMAARGQGFVEPNPMVGCVIAHGAEIIGEGWHRRFGGAHAEVEALQVAGKRARGSTLYVTLEPCCHHGKTPPCTDAIVAAGVARVVVAGADPFPQVAGGGIARLQAAGIKIDVGLKEAETRELNAPYLKLLSHGRPWVIAKWAMTLDGKLATRSGDSRWISGEASRALVHQIRGRVDGILVGRGTVQQDDPLLTARPSGPRVATRIVLDSEGSLSGDSNLAKTADEAPVLIVTASEPPPQVAQSLRERGCEFLFIPAATRAEQLVQLLGELGNRRMTNLLVEGGAAVLGAFFDAGLVDEVLVFIAPRIVGGQRAITPVAGEGRQLMAQALTLCQSTWQQSGPDIVFRGRVGASP